MSPCAGPNAYWCVACARYGMRTGRVSGRKKARERKKDRARSEIADPLLPPILTLFRRRRGVRSMQELLDGHDSTGCFHPRRGDGLLSGGRARAVFMQRPPPPLSHSLSHTQSSGAARTVLGFTIKHIHTQPRTPAPADDGRLFRAARSPCTTAESGAARVSRSPPRDIDVCCRDCVADPHLVCMQEASKCRQRLRRRERGA